MWCAAAGCVIAAGLVVGGPAAVAAADPGGPHYGRDHDRSRQTSAGPGERPATRVGSGVGATLGISSQPGGLAGSNVSGAGPRRVDEGMPDDDGRLRYRDGNPCYPGVHVPFPALGWSGYRWPDHYDQGPGIYQLPVIPDLRYRLAQPPPPQPGGPTPAVVGVEPEPVVQSDANGHDRETELAEPQVLNTPPVIVAPPIAIPPVPPVPPVAPPPVPVTPGAGAGTGSGPAIPQAPAEPVQPPLRGGQWVPGTETQPGGSAMLSRAPGQAGNDNYLRTAATGELAVVALPGLAGMLLLTAGGSLIGYRQAKTGHSVRTRSIDRFLN
jgi:hypothetical protein